MTATEKLKSILTENYLSEDGDEYKVELKKGLTEKEIEELAKKLPTGKLPNEIIELLKFTSGFEFDGLEEITLTALNNLDLKNFFLIQSNLQETDLGIFGF